MLNRSSICILPIATLFICPFVWLALHADLLLNNARAAASTALPPKTTASEPSMAVHAARQTTTRLLALDQVKRLAFWTVFLRSNKLARDVVLRATYQGSTDSGVDYWSVGCRDGYYYSMAINAEPRDSACTRDALAQTAESAPLAGSSDP